VTLNYAYPTQKRTICLMGPTASGKTDLAYALVQRFPCEIISVDSGMIYRGMNIGTAKPDADFLRLAPHHLIDICSPIETYSAAQFCADVTRLSQNIWARGHTPLLVGGTMLYFRALQQGLSRLPDADSALRSELLTDAMNRGWEAMHATLQEVDPISAARIHVRDTQRIQRALEVYRLTGKPMSDVFLESRDSPQANYLNILLMPDSRAWLHARIASRFEQMLQDGLLEEVNELMAQWAQVETCPAMRCVGYRQVLDYLHGNTDYPGCVAKGIAATRQLAKRQMTWLRHWEDGHVLSADDPAIFSHVIDLVERHIVSS
jgi:tRNA dimethylallyltransferase